MLAKPRVAVVSAPPMPRSADAEMRLGGGGFGGDFDPRELIPPLVFGALLASGILGWLFQGLFIFLFVVPLVAAPLINWWVSSNLLEGTCPDCGAPIQTLKGQRTTCLNCGALVADELASSGVFMRVGSAATGDGVVEVDAVVDVDVM
jgi:hypothetical protein